MPTKGGVSPSTVVELEDLLKGLESERDEIKRRLAEQLQDVERRIAAINTTLSMLVVTTDGLGRDSAIRKLISDSNNRFAGLSQFEAMVKVAEESPGRTVRPTDVAPILKKAGLAKGNLRNLVPHLYRMLRESPRFDKVSPGTFRLQPAQVPAVFHNALGQCFS